MTDTQRVFPCFEEGHPATGIHRHSRWTSNPTVRFSLHGDIGSTSGAYPQHGPDGEELRFTRDGSEVTFTPLQRIDERVHLDDEWPEPDPDRTAQEFLAEPEFAEHDSTPLWPIEECTETHDVISAVHYHLPRTRGSHRMGWSSRVINRSTTERSVQGRRFATPDYARANGITFATEQDTTTTEESSTMTMTPGTVVTSRGTRPTSVGRVRHLVVLGPNPTVQNRVVVACAVDQTAGTGWGWGYAQNSTYLRSLPQEVRDYIATHRVTMWSVPEGDLVPVDTPALTGGMERLRQFLLTREEAAPSSGQVDIRPLDDAKVRQYPSFTLHSILGTRRGNNIIFGCQTFDIAVVAAANGTISFEDGGVRVSMPATGRVNGWGEAQITVGDRTLSAYNVNDYTERITADPAAVVTTPVEDAVVMRTGYYGCEAHPNEVLHLTRGAAGQIRLSKVYPLRSGDRAELNRPELTGIIGQRSGLRGRHFRDCRPVLGSTSDQVMYTDDQSRYALVPTDESQREWLSANRYALASMPVTAAGPTVHIVECNAEGQPVVTTAAQAA